MRFRTMIALGVALGVVSCAPTPKDELSLMLERNAEARGGAAAIESIKSVRTIVDITEPTFAVTGDYRAKDGAMRIDIYAEGARVFSEGVDDDGAWQQGGANAPIEAASEKGRAALLHGIEFNLFGIHQLAARGHKVEFDGDETLDAVAYKVLRVTLSDGFETYLYLNPDTMLIERRRDIRALHPDADPTERLIENRYSDFESFCGVLAPKTSLQIDARTGDEMQRAVVKSQECNLSDADLKIPRDAAVN